ncbi:N-acetylglucosamine-6-phosphate deacetylase [Deinococcus sp. Arct2-2]|uniref:N-acetylglucosamine-6-phosphate deacetylase n=1 Tax=Deinococcus sp. Arct2-2 TaxID=2568653 RepID=UPI0010A2C6E8|nr:N-acetylglucosamine-6-phosphate deacetylase [Deinococcus sp. Arct2-2]THF68387.1 N-acetylglucosamine-6-phosphate deacetylase [Deinococcus sp. Arct2-2]
MTVVEGQIWTPLGWQAGRLTFEATITAFEALPQAPDEWIAPGFIDVHVHGGGGADVMDGPDGIRQMARFHAGHGTTALLATTITRPWEDVLQALRAVRDVSRDQRSGEAQVLGAHLEGPFINPGKLGAQPPFALNPSAARLQQVLESGALRVVTLAPELPGALAASAVLARSGVRVSFGHTLATAAEAAEVISAVQAAGGTVAGTHFFNAMTGFSGREPGVVGALLARPDTFAEVILDTHHVHLESFRALMQAKPHRTLLITDAMRAAGMPDGRYELGGQPVLVQAGQARLPSGSLAGSLLTMDQAVRQAVRAGLSLHQAVSLASVVPAQYLNLTDRGDVQPGQRADLVILGQQGELHHVYLAGRLNLRSHTIT